MNEMHMDMAGGAAVIGAIAAIADLQLPVNVVGIIPAAENMVSGNGLRPGDILKSMSVALVVAALSGYASIAWLLRFLGSHRLVGFALYRGAVAIAVASLLISGTVSHMAGV